MTRPAPPRFAAIRSAGSLLQVYDRQADRVLFDHARLQPSAARAEADRLNAAETPLTRAGSGTAHKARGTSAPITDEGVAAFLAAEVAR